MATYRELLAQVKTEIDEVDARRARELFETGDPVIVDVREQDEWDEGHIPGAIHIPRGNLESRIEAAAPSRERQVVIYCAAGNRSAFASWARPSATKTRQPRREAILTTGFTSSPAPRVKRRCGPVRRSV